MNEVIVLYERSDPDAIFLRGEIFTVRAVRRRKQQLNRIWFPNFYLAKLATAK